MVETNGAPWDLQVTQNVPTTKAQYHKWRNLYHCCDPILKLKLPSFMLGSEAYRRSFNAACFSSAPAFWICSGFEARLNCVASRTVLKRTALYLKSCAASRTSLMVRCGWVYIWEVFADSSIGRLALIGSSGCKGTGVQCLSSISACLSPYIKSA